MAAEGPVRFSSDVPVHAHAPAPAPPVADWPGDPTPDEIARRQLWRELGLTDEEFAAVVRGLGRRPNWTELGMFSVLWSEHCAYKHSREALRWLPTSGGRLVVGPGENAGVLDIGGGFGLAVRLESHNHPSFVEPYQGAATGVGGIVRDVLAAGARPVALLNSLRFGRPEGHRANRRLFEQVVAGIAGYGNCIGVPTVGGEVAFDPCYELNPLVNVMCVGLVRLDRIARARAEGPGNPVYLVGARTGRDGIHGAGLLASRSFDEQAASQRPRVQVGDPFMEKLLIEACLEALQTGAVVGLQDLGAAGITAACAEMAARAGSGMEIDLDRVPLREAGMTPFELLLSESQERMMLVVDRARAREVESVLARWGLWWAQLGTVTGDGRLRVRQGGRLVADVPAALLAGGAPRHSPPPPRRHVPAGGQAEREAEPARSSPGPARPGGPDGTGATAGTAAAAGAGAGRTAAARQLAKRLTTRLLRFFASVDGASREWIYSQFDHMVGVRTELVPGHDAAVLRFLEGIDHPAPPPGGARPARVAVCVDGAEWLARRSPYLAAAEAVFEAARNVAAVGAEPIGITNGLNLASPEHPEVMQELSDTVAGLADACSALGIPVTGGNVSLYNETGSRRIVPTAIVGMVGLLGDGPAVPSGFQAPGDLVVLIGEPYFGPPADEPPWAEPADRPAPSPDGGATRGREPVPWPLDFAEEARRIRWVARAGRDGLVRSCHDLSRLGIAHGLCEAALLAREGADGFSVELQPAPGWPQDLERVLLGAAGPCWVASVAPELLATLRQRAEAEGIALRVLGTVVPGQMRLSVGGVGQLLNLPTEPTRRSWQAGLGRA